MMGIDWELIKNIATILQSVLASIALIVGGVWGYYRFIRFRTFKPQLDFLFDFKHFLDGQGNHIGILELKLSNKGNTQIELRKNKSNVCFLKYGLIEAAGATEGVVVISKSSKQLDYIDEVFIAHKWIEPNETIDDVKVIRIPNGNSIALQIEVEILGTQKWSSITAFPLIGSITASKFISEDEQDNITDTERVIAKLKTKLALSKATSMLSKLPENKKEELGALVAMAESLLNKLARTSSQDKKLLKQVWGLVQKFDGLLE